MYLLFDTETTGVPRDYNAPLTNFLNWPRLVQLGLMVLDKEFNEIIAINRIVFPMAFTIPEDAARVHGITTEIARQKGELLQKVLIEFSWIASYCDVVVCHNYNYDSKIIGCEFLRCGMENAIANKKSICTMDSSKEFVGLQGPFGFKWPKLIELHMTLFDKPFEMAHDALGDVRAMANCFRELVKRKIITL